MHYLLTEALKLGSMQGFCHVISDHLVCQTIFDVSVAFGLLVRDIEVVKDTQNLYTFCSSSVC